MGGEKAPERKWDGEENKAKREFIDGVMYSSQEIGLCGDQEQWHANLPLSPVEGTGNIYAMLRTELWRHRE